MLYEIVCTYPAKSGPTTLLLKDYLEYFLPRGERRDVIGLDRARLEMTLQRLKMISPEDYVFEIKEVAQCP